MPKWRVRRGLSPMFVQNLCRIGALIEVKLEKLIMKGVKKSVKPLNVTLTWSPTIRAH